MASGVLSLVKVTVGFEWAGETASINWHMWSPTTNVLPTVAQIQALGAALAAKLDDAAYTEWLTSAATITSLRITSRGSDPGYVYELAFNQAGQGGVGALPHQVACVVTLQSDGFGRSGRGRVYLPFITTFGGGDLFYDETTGLFTPELTERCVIFMAGFDTFTVAGKVWELGVYSPTNDSIFEVVSLRCGSVPDTQRRRRRSLIEVYSTSAPG